MEKHFSSYASKTLPVRKRPQNPQRDGLTHTIKQKNKRNSLILMNMLYDAPCYASLDDKRLFYGLTVLNHMLGGNSTTDFYHQLVEQKEIALSVGSDYNGMSRDPQCFSLTASLPATGDVNHLRQEILFYIKRLRENGFAEAEIIKAKNELVAELEKMKDGTQSLFMTIAQYLASDIDLKELSSWVQHINDVTPGDLNKALHVVFDALPAVTIEMHPDGL